MREGFRVIKNSVHKWDEGWRPLRRCDCKELTVSEAVALLAELGSSNDPIVYKGEETDPESLMYEHFPSGLDRESVRITYWGVRKPNPKRSNRRHGPLSRCVKKVHGTLIGMCRDRAGF